MIPPIKHFKDRYAFLSNFYPCRILVARQLYPTLEHAYQASKTRLAQEKEEIRIAESPGKAKRLGQQVTLIDGWEKKKLLTMRVLLLLKFSDPCLQLLLISTGDAELIEGNRWGDTFWVR